MIAPFCSTEKKKKKKRHKDARLPIFSCRTPQDTPVPLPTDVSHSITRLGSLQLLQSA